MPFQSGVVSGNANVAIAGLYAWCWAIGRSDGRIGAAAAVATIFKLFPGVMVFWPTGRARVTSIVLAGGRRRRADGRHDADDRYAGVARLPDGRVAHAQPACLPLHPSVSCALMPTFGSRGSEGRIARAGGLLVRVGPPRSARPSQLRAPRRGDAGARSTHALELLADRLRRSGRARRRRAGGRSTGSGRQYLRSRSRCSPSRPSGLAVGRGDRPT